MRIITHNGHFHADELLAVAALLLKFPDAEVVRTRDEEVIKTGDIVVDVGQVYDPAKGRFDHHQAEGAGKRENGIPYASFGLIWKEYGKELAGGEEGAKVVEEKLVVPVDARDNGIDISTPIYESVREYRIGDYFDSFASPAHSLDESDRFFTTALVQAKDLVGREISIAKQSVADWKEVRDAYEKAHDKRLVVIERHMHWRKALIDTEAVYVVYPRPDEKWAVNIVPKDEKSFEAKKDLPVSWAGLSEQDLARASGVSDAVFCHKARFLCVALSREGAIKLAEIALNS